MMPRLSMDFPETTVPLLIWSFPLMTAGADALLTSQYCVLSPEEIGRFAERISNWEYIRFWPRPIDRGVAELIWDRRLRPNVAVAEQTRLYGREQRGTNIFPPLLDGAAETSAAQIPLSLFAVFGVDRLFEDLNRWMSHWNQRILESR